MNEKETEFYFHEDMSLKKLSELIQKYHLLNKYDRDIFLKSVQNNCFHR